MAETPPIYFDVLKLIAARQDDHMIVPSDPMLEPAWTGSPAPLDQAINDGVVVIVGGKLKVTPEGYNVLTAHGWGQ